MMRDAGYSAVEMKKAGYDAKRLYEAMLRHGHGRDGTQALTLALDMNLGDLPE